MTTPKKRYDRKLTDLTARYGRLEEYEVARALELLSVTRFEIERIVTGTEWQAFRMNEMRAAIDAATDKLRLRYQAAQQSNLSNVWLAGIDMIAAPIAAAGISVGLTTIPMTTLELAQGYSANLIGGLSADLRKRVVSEVQLGLLGAKTPYDVMKALGMSLTDKGAFKSIAARAEAITLTEMGRVHSAGRQLRANALVDLHPEITWVKRWHSSHKAHPRPVHASLNKSTVPINENFVGRIPYPHAPGLEAADVVNCGCTHTVEPDWQQVDTDALPVPYQEQVIWN